jgi:hypothetical protein
MRAARLIRQLFISIGCYSFCSKVDKKPAAKSSGLVDFAMCGLLADHKVS